MKQKTLHEEIFEATRTIDRIAENIEKAIEYLEWLQKDGKDDWQIQSSILELKEAKNRLGYKEL